MPSAGCEAASRNFDDNAILETVWRMPMQSGPLFAGSFLSEISVQQIEAVIDGLKRECGSFEKINSGSHGTRHSILTEKCEIPTLLRLDADGKIVGLLFQQPIRRDANLQDLLAEVSSFDGSVSYVVYENDALIAGRAVEKPLAVGSAFKLIVLAELQKMIAHGDAHWRDVVRLKDGQKSLPSGRLQNMPVGSPFTLHTLATAMIAESDNTATDMLVDFIGRHHLEQASGIKPFLKTREVFQLKAHPELYKRYTDSTLVERHELLREMETMDLPSAQSVSGPWLIHAEWLISTSSLCEWLKQVSDLKITQINPGIVDRSRWQSIAYKGGSETGVLNLTTQVRDERNRRFCVSMTWNADRPFDHDRLYLLYSSIFEVLATR